jgi:hypothetical protein
MYCTLHSTVLSKVVVYQCRCWWCKIKKSLTKHLESSHSESGYKDLNNLFLPGRWWFQTLILRHIYIKKVFPFFWAVSSPFAVQVCKKCPYDPVKNFWFQKWNMGIKKRRIWFWFRICWKLMHKKMSTKKWQKNWVFFTFITVCVSFRTVVSSLGRYVFGSEISYNKAPPRLPGLGC